VINTQSTTLVPNGLPENGPHQVGERLAKLITDLAVAIHAARRCEARVALPISARLMRRDLAFLIETHFHLQAVLQDLRREVHDLVDPLTTPEAKRAAQGYGRMIRRGAPKQDDGIGYEEWRECHNPACEARFRPAAVACGQSTEYHCSPECAATCLSARPKKDARHVLDHHTQEATP
jgi:hypothetical protein